MKKHKILDVTSYYKSLLNFAFRTFFSLHSALYLSLLQRGKICVIIDNEVLCLIGGLYENQAFPSFLVCANIV